MKTTELYIEQVLIGFLISVIVLLPWLPEAIRLLSGFDSLSGVVAAASSAAGIAFFLGVPFERLSDSLTERLDRLQRLSVAFSRAQEPEGKMLIDLYPEDVLTLRCRSGPAAHAEWMDYLRSRIRLSRALAVYGPALTITAAYGIYRLQAGVGEPRAPIYVWVAAAYLLWTMLVLLSNELPRTKDPNFVEDAKKGVWIAYWPWNVWPGLKKDAEGRWKVRQLAIWFGEWQTWLVPVALLAAAGLAFTDCAWPWPALVAGAGALLTVLSAWSWWRITITFRKFLLDADPLKGGAKKL